MKKIMVGQTEMYERNGNVYAIWPGSTAAMEAIDWAASILAKPEYTMPNGRYSHDVAYDIIETAEDDLIDYLCIR